MKSIDESLPHLAIEVVADGLTNDREQSERLCKRMRMHWQTNEGFRRSFKRKDSRIVAAMWFDHWIKSELKSGEFLVV